MSQRYSSDGHGYVQNQLFQIRPPVASPHNNGSSSTAQSGFSTSQALPPLPTTSYPASYSSDPFVPARLPSTQSSGQPQMSNSTNNASLAHGLPMSSFPIYGPTSATHYAPLGLNVASPNPQRQHMAHNSAASDIARLPYAISTPQNIQLPKIQPASGSSNANVKSMFLHDHKAAHLSPATNHATMLESLPKHVVGSQGRRGILPSAAGRPPAIPHSSSGISKAAPALTKDSDGKFLCPHCAKPYLHAKHLKRHMLRHTGIRPYECALCHDTFSRSDILKRHFQKCSVRRGNPTGENHLAYSRANKKQRQQQNEQQAAAAANNNTPLPSETGLSLPSYTTSLTNPISLAGIGLEQSSFSERQEPLANQIPRSNGIRHTSGLGSDSNRGSTSSLNTSAFDPVTSYPNGHMTPDSVTTSGAATPYTYPQEARSTLSSPADGVYTQGLGMGLGAPRVPSNSFGSGTSLPQIAGSASNRGQDVDWASFQTYPSNDDFNHMQYHTGSNTNQQAYKGDADFNTFDWSLPQSKQ